MPRLGEKGRESLYGPPSELGERASERPLEVLDLRVGEVRAGRHGRRDPSLARLDVGDRRRAGCGRVSARSRRLAPHREVAARVYGEERERRATLDR